MNNMTDGGSWYHDGGRSMASQLLRFNRAVRVLVGRFLQATFIPILEGLVKDEQR